MKKAISLLLALLLSAGTLTTLAGCSESEVNSDPGETAAPVSSDGEAAPVEEEEEVFVDPFLGTDFGGREFRIYTSVDTNDASNADQFIRGSGELNGEAVNDAVFERNSYVQELLNIALSYTEANYDYSVVEANVKKSIMAGTDEWDVMANDIRTFANLSRDGCIRNVYNSSILDLSQSYWYAEAMKDCQFIEGGMYLLIGDYFTDALASSHALYVNETLLNNYYGDTEYINRMVFDGNWTFDAMTEIVNNCYLDSDGSGSMQEGDQYGFTCLGMWGSMIPFLIGTGIQFVERTDSGIQFCFNNERSITILDKLNKLFYADGTLTSYAEGTVVGLRTIFANGQTLIMGYNRLGNLADLRDIEFGVGIVPYPKLDETQANYVSSMHDISEIGAIPATLPTDSVDFCHTCLEVFCRETGRTVIPEYYENGLKIKYVNGQDDAKMIDLIHDSICSPFAVAYDSALSNFMLSTCFSAPLQANNSDFASAYKKSEKAANKILEKATNAFAEVLLSGN